MEKKRYSSGYHIDWHRNEHRASHKKAIPEIEKTAVDIPVSVSASTTDELTSDNLKNDVSLLFSPKAFVKATAKETKRKIETMNFAGRKLWQKNKSKSVDPELEAEARFAKKTNTALYLSIAGWVATLLSAVPELVGISSVLSLIAIVSIIVGFAMAAGCLKEIKNDPNYSKYYGKAFAAYLLGLIYFILLLLVLLILILLIALLLAAV
jgi:hypothetical protein